MRGATSSVEGLTNTGAVGLCALVKTITTGVSRKSGLTNNTGYIRAPVIVASTLSTGRTAENSISRQVDKTLCALQTWIDEVLTCCGNVTVSPDYIAAGW